MLCEICKKELANIYFTQIVNGVVTKLHLCESCAKKKGIGGISFPDGMYLDFAGLALAEILASLADFGTLPRKGKDRCINCGLSIQDLKQTGRFGCSECYKTFRSSLIPILKKIHGKTEHLGKVPLKSNIKLNFQRELLSLKKELQGAVTKEEYERAAQIRDKIRAIEKENGD